MGSGNDGHLEMYGLEVIRSLLSLNAGQIFLKFQEMNTSNQEISFLK